MPDLPPGLRPLAEYLRDRQSMTREQFLRAHSTPALVVPLVAQVADADAFNTRPLPLQSGPARSWAVATVSKRSGDAFPNFIWVGRESKCDITLPFEGLSKLHAQFILRPDGGMELLDTGSANGTFLDGERLQDNAPQRIRDGVKIRMGPLEMIFRTAAGLWEELGAWPREAPP